MSYHKTTIKQTIMDIEGGKMYLPALQRKFVWGKAQIELLFDSLMRNYPIGTFLFWKLKGSKANEYVFYDFLRKYDERHPFNTRKEGAFLLPEIIGVLDGQQRLSSMYIGLQGTHTNKRPYKRHSSRDAYCEMSLYLNLLALPYHITENAIETDEERNFGFCFLSEADAKSSQAGKDTPAYWFKVGDILKWGDEPEFDVIIDNFIERCGVEGQKERMQKDRRLIRKAISCLHQRIMTDQLISYFEVVKDELEDILKIFVRVNSGGTVLSTADLLFSTIVATWDNGRDEIETLIKTINATGRGFSFSNEFLMRCCLVLSDNPVQFKVKSFNSSNVSKIQKLWPDIKKAILDCADILSEFGFSGETLTSQNAVIIVAYHIFKGGDSSAQSKTELKKYVVHALLTNAFGSSQDQVISNLLSTMRKDNVDENGNKKFELISKAFTFERVAKTLLPGRKSLHIKNNDLDSFLEVKKSAKSFSVLVLLYPHLRYREISFHQDHIHPFSGFSSKAFDEMMLSEEERAIWLNYRDMLPNLQLMEERQNESKNKTPFFKWLNTAYPDQSHRNTFCVNNHLPMELNLDFSGFIDFFEKRKSVLRGKLLQVLSMSNETSSTQEIDALEVNPEDDEADVLSTKDPK